MTYVPPIADRATPKGVARLVEIARAFHADPNDMALRTAFVRATFNHDRHAALIVALADEAASPLGGPTLALDDPKPLS